MQPSVPSCNEAFLFARSDSRNPGGADTRSAGCAHDARQRFQRITLSLPTEALMNSIAKFFLPLTAMLVAGCSDSSVAPKASASSDVTIQGGGSTAALTTTDTI